MRLDVSHYDDNDGDDDMTMMVMMMCYSKSKFWNRSIMVERGWTLMSVTD